MQGECCGVRRWAGSDGCERWVIVGGVKAARMAGVGLGNEVGERNRLVARPRLGEPEVQLARGRNAAARPQLFQIGPPVESTKRMVASRNDSVTQLSLLHLFEPTRPH